jgi:hypothetical protein
VLGGVAEGTQQGAEMRDLLLLAAHRPEIPLGLAVFLYAWTAAGYAFINQMGLAWAWGCYALANIGFLHHTLKLQDRI